MLDFDKIKPEPHPARQLIRDFNIPVWKVAKYLGLSYYHTCHVLAGRFKPSRKVRPKLDQLVEYLEKKGRTHGK